MGGQGSLKSVIYKELFFQQGNVIYKILHLLKDKRKLQKQM